MGMYPEKEAYLSAAEMAVIRQQAAEFVDEYLAKKALRRNREALKKARAAIQAAR